MKKYFTTISLTFLFLFLIIVSNSKAEKINDCREKHSSCLEDCREKYDLPEQSSFVEPGELNRPIKVQRFETRKEGRQCVATCRSQLRTCRLSSKSNNAERTKIENTKVDSDNYTLPSNSKIFQWKDENDKIHYSNDVDSNPEEYKKEAASTSKSP